MPKHSEPRSIGNPDWRDVPVYRCGWANLLADCASSAGLDTTLGRGLSPQPSGQHYAGPQ